jgi:hypothetical protein
MNGLRIWVLVFVLLLFPLSLVVAQEETNTTFTPSNILFFLAIWVSVILFIKWSPNWLSVVFQKKAWEKLDKADISKNTIFQAIFSTFLVGAILMLVPGGIPALWKGAWFSWHITEDILRKALLTSPIFDQTFSNTAFYISGILFWVFLTLFWLALGTTLVFIFTKIARTKGTNISIYESAGKIFASAMGTGGVLLAITTLIATQFHPNRAIEQSTAAIIFQTGIILGGLWFLYLFTKKISTTGKLSQKKTLAITTASLTITLIITWIILFILTFLTTSTRQF